MQSDRGRLAASSRRTRLERSSRSILVLGAPCSGFVAAGFFDAAVPGIWPPAEPASIRFTSGFRHCFLVIANAPLDGR